MKSLERLYTLHHLCEYYVLGAIYCTALFVDFYLILTIIPEIDFIIIPHFIGKKLRKSRFHG